VNKEMKSLQDALLKAKNEFDMAANCLFKALEDMHKRLERIETWMLESQKNLQQ
jgi:hypothetical protein